MDLLGIAKSGATKMYNALKKFFHDSQIFNEIYDEIDKNLFFAATQDERYCFIEDIKEDDIFDQFIDLCVTNASLDIDIIGFVDEHYVTKAKDAKDYIKWFYGQIALTIYNVLKRHVSLGEKIILKSQELQLKTISDRLDEINLFLNLEKNKNVLIVTYSANMQGKQWTLNRIVPSRVDLSIKNSPMQPESKEFWLYAQKSLVAEFNKRVLAFLEDGYAVDLYALAPIPLLVLLGNLFANRPNINIFQLKKVPSSFEWEEDGEKLDIKVTQSPDGFLGEEVALLMSFSGQVNKKNVMDAIGKKIPLIEMSIKEPFDDFLRAKSQLNEFITEYRKVKSSLASKGIKTIHLFAAIPIAFAIGIGQAYNPNYDPNLVTYDFRQGIYSRALAIGGNYGFK